MKKLFLFIILLCIQISAQNEYLLNVNKIDLPLDNKGILADVMINGRNGGRIDSILYLFSAGFFMAGKNSNQIWGNAVSSINRFQDYEPGNVDSLPSNPLYKIYVINKNDTPFGGSWQDWKNAVRIGAEFYDGNNDNNYNPIDLNNNNKWDSNEDAPPLIGEELTWCLYNDGVIPDLRMLDTIPQGIEIRQTLFAFKKNFSNIEFEPLDYTIFVRYQILNTGKFSQVLDSVFFGFFADADIGYNPDDLSAADTLVQSGVIYNSPFDSIWGNLPPAYNSSLLQGPHSYIPGVTFIDNNSNNKYEEGIDTPLDSALIYKGILGVEKIPGAKNLQIKAVVNNVTGDVFPEDAYPDNPEEVFWVLNGKWIHNNYINPCDYPRGIVNGVDCNKVNPVFWYSGDPITNVGWINTQQEEKMHYVSTGPFTLEAGKPVDILYGSIIAGGNNNLDAVRRGRDYTRQIHEFVQSNFSNFNITDVKENKNIPANFSLSQNYPNPFNPSTKINYTLPYTAKVKLQVYDVLGNLITTIVNEEQNAGSYKVDLDLSKFSSGIYFFQLQAGNFIQTKKMILMK
ncbi:MAG TPA: T9SS type A sorting domain-containing protein [Ignavibacteriaceae bacterium]|nr:T9SS type A sorting domain-containing protein [Ignavibacteriaceae bacterium]